MQKINIFSLQTHLGEYKNWPLKTLLLKNGESTTTYLPGYELLHQFELPASEYLLITDWDCPFEEATEFILLDSTLKILAKRKLAVPYGSFLLENLQVLSEHTIRLEFDNKAYWKLSVMPKPVRASPFFNLNWLPIFKKRQQLKRL